MPAYGANGYKVDLKLKSNSFEGLALNLEMQHVTGFTKGCINENRMHVNVSIFHMTNYLLYFEWLNNS